jgi:hypothetical protein
LAASEVVEFAGAADPVAGGFSSDSELVGEFDEDVAVVALVEECKVEEGDVAVVVVGVFPPLEAGGAGAFDCLLELLALLRWGL